MVFLNNMLMMLSHVVFNIPLDLIYDQCYPYLGFLFVQIIVNPLTLVFVLKIN